MINWDELKRRNVVKVGIAYLALGWVVVQVTDLAIPALNLPPVLLSTVFFLGLIGFPFALFFAWAFELTPEGLKKTADVTEADSIASLTSRKLDFFIIAALLLAVAFLLYDRGDDSVVTNQGPPETSIAVLPFINMSGDVENEYFSDGISEEILDGLAKVNGLRVVARTSSFYFKGQRESITTIGEKLRVGTILEGSVRKVGNRVRITAQLIRVSDQTHIWSETYDRTLNDIFAIQDEIAQKIVTQLKIPLGVQASNSLIAHTTTHPEAYQAYLRGRNKMGWQSYDTTLEAVRDFEYAVTLDPEYAAAYGSLALARFYLVGYEPVASHLKASVEYAEIALRLEPGQPEAEIAWALYLSINDHNYRDAAEILAKQVEQASTSDAMAFYATFILSPTSSSTQAEKIAKEAIEKDPLNPLALMQAAFGLSMANNHSAALPYWEKCLKLDPYNFECLSDYANGSALNGDITIAESLALRMADIVSKNNIWQLQFTQALIHYVKGENELGDKLASLIEAGLPRTGAYFHLLVLRRVTGDLEGSLALMEELVNPDKTSGWFIFLRSFFKDDELIWSNPRYQALLRQLKLDDQSLREAGFL
ncbi:MAG: hypothetical protein V7711_07270 [Pseudomonadales bacterium]